MSEIRYITGCAAVHPDQRGGQHVAMACPGVLAIDDDAGIGVLVMEERSQFKNKEKATAMLAELRAHRAGLSEEELDSVYWLRVHLALAIEQPAVVNRDVKVRCLAVLDKLLAGGGGGK